MPGGWTDANQDSAVLARSAGTFAEIEATTARDRADRAGREHEVQETKSKLATCATCG